MYSHSLYKVKLGMSLSDLKDIFSSDWQDYLNYYESDRPYQLGFIDNIVHNFNHREFPIKLSEIRSYVSVGHGTFFLLHFSSTIEVKNIQV